MTLTVMTEPLFADAPWCSRIRVGLDDALRAKKLHAADLHSFSDVKPASDRETFLFLIGSNPAWLTAALERAHVCGLRPILLCSGETAGLPGPYSTVKAEIGEGLGYLLSALAVRGCKSVALYGVNPESLSDLGRKASFLSNSLYAVGEADVFYNVGSLTNLFETFAEHIGKYDGVVCVNSYAALHLCRGLARMKDAPPLCVTAFEETLLSRRFCEGLLTVSAPYGAFGRAALGIVETLLKNPDVTTLHARLSWLPSDGGTVKNAAAVEEKAPCPSADRADEAFYADTEIKRMMALENMLLACGKTELQILEYAMEGLSNEAIAARCFLSTETVKYHLKKCRTAVGAATKEELVGALLCGVPLSKKEPV